MRATVSILALVMALGITPAAQTLAEELQRGIYTEETLKNKDEAARIYRQILAAPTLPEAISTEAQRRLARLLLATEPTPSAEPAQSPSPTRSPGLSTGIPAPVEMGVSVVPEALRTLDKGRLLEGGRYQHVASGITFQVPSGWSVGGTYASSDDGDMVTLANRNWWINVWMIKETTPADQVVARVAGAPAEKVQQRQSGYRIPGMPDAQVSTYEIPADTLRPTLINGRNAMVAIASYLGFPMEPFRRPEGLHPMREYMTWIYTPQSRAFFFARVLANEVPQLRPVFEHIVNSAVVP